MKYDFYFQGSIEDWFKSIDPKNTIFRYWVKSDKETWDECEYGFFQQLIKIGDRYMVGINPLDEDKTDHRYESISWYYIGQ